MKRILLIVAMCLLPSLAYGATHTAADCNRDTLNSLINSVTVSNGDTVLIPNGTCTWTQQLTFTKGIILKAENMPTLDGNGRPTTNNVVIIDNGTTSGLTGSVLRWKCVSGEAHELGGIEFRHGNRAVADNNGVIRIECLNTSDTTFRIYQNRFTNLNGWTIHPRNVIGVMDHNVITSSRANQIGIYVFNPDWNTTLDNDIFGDRSYAGCDDGSCSTRTAFTFASIRAADSMPNALYIEDNEITWGSGLWGACTDAQASARYVLRFNDLTNCRLSIHGLETSNRKRSGLGVEMYANDFTMTTVNTNNGDIMGNIRGGTMLAFVNEAHDMRNGPTSIRMNLDRSVSNYLPWAMADGTNPGQAGPNPGGQWDVPDPGSPFTGTLTVAGCGGNCLTRQLKVTGAGWNANQWEGFVVRKNSCTPGNGPNGGLPCHELVSSNSTDTLFFRQSAHGPNDSFADNDTFVINKTTQLMDGVGRVDGSLICASVATCGSGTVQPTPPVGWNDQTTYPMYTWLNENNNTNLYVETDGSCNANCNANEHYYDYVGSVQSSQITPFNGQYGIGVGTRATQRPTTCTTGTAFWDPNQGSWNAATNANYTQQGVLDKCTATDTWTNAWYTPVAYPHILTLAGGALTLTVETAANGSGTVVPPQNVSNASGTVTAYAIRRTNGSFTSNDAVTWSLTNKTGNVVNGDLVAAGDSKSAVFTGSGIGTATVHIAETISSTAYTADSGTLTVVDTIAPTPGGGGAINCNNSVTSSTFSCTWSAGSDTVSAVGTLQYLVCRSTGNNINSVSTCAAKVVQDYSTAITSYAATGLAASTSYYHNVIIKDEAGNTALYTADEQTTSSGSPAQGGTAGGGLARSRPDDPKR